MAESKSLEDLSPFFSKPAANAIIVTDCKLDDAICLWYFFLLNFSRPAGHKVEIKLFVIGINDLPGGVALARHVYQQAKAHAVKMRRSSLAVDVECKIFASKADPPPNPVRHELDHYAPYNNGEKGFPQAKKETLKYFQDLDAKECGAKADFVGVICQFFWWGVLDQTGPGMMSPTFNANMLDYIVPKSGGMLAFQMGFNTRLAGGESEQTAFWDTLTVKVKEAGAKMSFVSNMFSFAKGDRKPGTIDPHSAPFCATLRQQAPKLWGHLFHAGALESCLFACDQMGKWIADRGVEPKGMDAPAKLVDQIAVCCKALQLDSSLTDKEISNALKAIVEEGDNGVARVLGACVDLHLVADETCGHDKAEYLKRAKLTLENFGHSLEITDGQHFMAIYQSRVSIMVPVISMTWNDKVGCLAPAFDGGISNGLMWAAKDVDVHQSLQWMEQGLDVPAAHNLTLGRTAPVEMSVTTNKPSKLYVTSARNLFSGSEVLSATELLTISGLGGAVSVAANVSAVLEHDGLGTIEKVETGYIDRGNDSNRRADAQIKITLRRRA